MKKTNLRKVTTKKGTLILAGRDEDSNESLIEQAKEDEDVFHTEKPGSPFVNIKGKPKAGDRKFAALICARYSHDWRDNKKDVIVHRFKGKEIDKTKGMKKGTFGVKKFKAIKIKKREIEEFG